MKIDLQRIRESLTSEQIISIVTELGANRYNETNNVIIFPTICHNEDSDEASMKLYYYKDSCMFHCYTECSENFDIIDLIKKVYNLKNIEFDFYSIVNKLANLSSLDFFSETNGKKYINNIATKEIKTEIELPKYDSKVLEMFRFYPTIEWLQDGITEETMRKFNIKYYDYRNKVVIPHYDIDNNLIGIRGRSLNKEDIELYGKYTPLKIENIMYSHPLSFNLYGINFNKEDIKKYKKTVIYEGEKSVLLMDQYYDYNISVASCGSNLNYRQVELLVKHLGVNEITIAYDKEFTNFASKEAENYYSKLRKICLKYSNYCNFYFLFDFNNLLRLKDSPIDKGKEIFEKLMRTRVKVEN
jgi:hypothetical protein